MSTRLNRVTEEYKDKFPHMKQYAACQSQAFMSGCFTFVAGSASAYIAQEVLRAKLPFGRKNFLLVSVAVGTVSSYMVTRYYTRMCQEMWMAMEEKHSVITPLHERLQNKSVTQSEDSSSVDSQPPTRPSP